ncbi:MAG: DUF3800 domain-containing protein [Bacteroidetes bacterium]|nr:MAG: DUF3800 domain-containing protein [Bacteroidota bacterium]
MILCYIDESGTGLKDKGSAYFVLAAVTIRSRDWKRMDSEISALKRQLISWAKPEDWEIKGRELRRGEKLFRQQNWPRRAKAFIDIATYLERFPCRLFAVQVDKSALPGTVETDTDLYRIAFWQLLDILSAHLTQDLKEEVGMLLVDMRSDMHSSVQDRRLVDVFREWLASRSGQTPFIELPWFGFSNFYAGIQLADFTAYMVDFVSNEREHGRRSSELYHAFGLMESKLKVVRIP